MRIAAFDLSLTQTGHALTGVGVGTIRPVLKGIARLHEIRRRVLEIATGTDLVVIEGYAFARANQAHQLGELGGVIRLALWDARIPYVEIPPATLKKFATGKGNANKEEMLAAAIRRLGYEGANNNEADALWLLKLASVGYGLSDRDLPKAHLDALGKIHWPEIGRAA